MGARNSNIDKINREKSKFGRPRGSISKKNRLLREMIDKIEHEVGGDLHMIRVNGVVVGAFIGLILGLIRAAVDFAF